MSKTRHFDDAEKRMTSFKTSFNKAKEEILLSLTMQREQQLQQLKNI